MSYFFSHISKFIIINILYENIFIIKWKKLYIIYLNKGKILIITIFFINKKIIIKIDNNKNI